MVTKHCPDMGEDVEFRPIRTGKFNTSYFMNTPQKELVLRIAPPPDSEFVFYERDMMRQEPSIHSILREKTNVPVAEILAYDGSRSKVGRDYLIMERLPGRPMTEMPHVAQGSVLRQIGRYLSEVHSITAGRYGYLGPHRPMEPQSDWPSAFRTMWGKLIDDIARIDYYSEEESKRLKELLDRNIHLFDRPVPASLLHMDIWHQNILADETGNVTGILDWDRALWGDPEIEFAVLDYCGISKPPFWEGYGKSREQSHDARIRQIFYLAYEIQKYIVIRHGRGHNPALARQYKQHSLRLIRQIPFKK
jgi:aminoglycoside phosphotransferase (APT) family kinase protein